MAAIGQDNELGEEAFNAIDIQAAVHGMELVATEEVEVLSTAVAPAVLAVIDSGAEGVLTATDNAQNGLIMDQFFEAGFDPLMCSDAGSSGAGGQNTVGLANPDAADGYLGTLQVALPDTDSPFVNNWRDLWDAYDGPGKEGGAPNFSLQSYSITVAFFEAWDRLILEKAFPTLNFRQISKAILALPRFSAGNLLKTSIAENETDKNYLARRNPKLLPALDGRQFSRLAERQSGARLNQLPPRPTRSKPDAGPVGSLLGLDS